jgi:hypothetical protein
VQTVGLFSGAVHLDLLFSTRSVAVPLKKIFHALPSLPRWVGAAPVAVENESLASALNRGEIAPDIG